MKYYVLQVMTGKEIRVRDALQLKGIDAYVPREMEQIHSGGVWNEQERTLLPGYVFTGLEVMTAEDWHITIAAARLACGHARLLGDPTPISDAEAIHLALLCPNNDPVQPSVIEFDTFGTPHIISGPLLSLAGQIDHLDRHRRRATVCVSLLGEIKKIRMGITPIDTKGGA